MREVHQELGKNNGYTTTLKQMQLMADKVLVTRSERFRSHIYQAAAYQRRSRRRPQSPAIC